MLTDTVMTAPPGLIDHEAVAQAAAARDATLRRAHEARLAHARAEADLAAANRAADDAAAMGGDLHTSQDRVDAAERAAKIAARVLTAAEAAAAQAPRAHRAALGAAHLGAAFDAIHRRLAAIRAHEAALAAAQAAKVAFSTATDDLLRYANLGTDIRGAIDAPRVLPSLSHEIAHWRGNQVDIGSLASQEGASS